MKKRLSVLNLFSVLLVIVINYTTQAMRVNETTIGEVSNKYFNLFTPASYAFAIWGLIFIALIAYGIYQIQIAFFSDKLGKFIEDTGYWFIITNILNCIWVFVFAYDYIGISVLIMLGILFSLVKIILNTNMKIKQFTTSDYIFGRFPIGIYSGWIAVATIANISAYLAKLQWDGAFLSEANWTITIIIVAIALYLIILFKRNILEFAAVGVWALFAIYIRHQHEYKNIAYTAITGCSILLIAILWKAYKNRKRSMVLNASDKFKTA